MVEREREREREGEEKRQKLERDKNNLLCKYIILMYCMRK